MDTRARHALIECWGCPFDIVDRPELLEEALLDAARVLESRVLGKAFHKFEPQGASGVLLIDQSHISVHTWPEHGYAALDIYTCGAGDLEHATRVISEALRAQRTDVRTLRRGEN